MGIIMTILIGLGFLMTLANGSILVVSECKSTMYAFVGGINVMVFVVLASFTILFVHIVYCLPKTR